MNTVYMVYGNTCVDIYGENVNIFGIFRSRDAAEEAKAQKEIEYFGEKRGLTENGVEHSFKIVDISLDEIIDGYLGGYVE